MKKLKLLSIFLFLFISYSYAQRPSLKFNQEGKFKIIQITDTHYIFNNPKSEVVPQLLYEVIEREKPDLFIFTGDMVWKNEDTKAALDALFAPVIAKQIPWAYVFGNHDDEAEMSRNDMMDYVTQMPYCLATHGDKNLSGVGNYTLEVKNREGNKTSSVLYCFDSHAYTPIKGIGTYAWFNFDQIDWYTNESKAYAKENDNNPLPSLAFFHIPLAEYSEMSQKAENYIGFKEEKECNGILNSGMFTAMRMNGDIMGTFVGHDHDNDYIGVWHDIALAYGRYSGGKTVYNNLGKNGCRVIELTEGERAFHSYVYLLGGGKKDFFSYPIPQKEKKSVQ